MKNFISNRASWGSSLAGILKDSTNPNTPSIKSGHNRIRPQLCQLIEESSKVFRRRVGFTLFEILVVVAIIGVLVAIVASKLQSNAAQENVLTLTGPSTVISGNESDLFKFELANEVKQGGKVTSRKPLMGVKVEVALEGPGGPTVDDGHIWNHLEAGSMTKIDKKKAILNTDVDGTIQITVKIDNTGPNTLSATPDLKSQPSLSQKCQNNQCTKSVTFLGKSQ